MEKRLSSNLQWLLKKHQLSSTQLSRNCGMAQPVLHRLVVGTIDNPQINTLLPLCKYFNCSIDALMFTDLTIVHQTIPLNPIEIGHVMRNSLTVINSLIKGLEKTLPIFIQSYLSLPKDLRIGDISVETMSMIPQMLSHTIEAISTLRASINRL